MITTKKQQIAMTNVKIIHHNIRRLNNKINDLKIFIQENQPDITINETLKKTKHKNIQLHHNTTRRQHRTRYMYYTQKQLKNRNT